MIGDDVPRRGRRVDDPALVNGRDDPLARRRAEKVPALGQDGDLEGGQGAVRGPPGLVLDLVADVGGRVLEGLEAGDEDVRQQQQAVGAAVVVLAEAAQDAGGDELAEGGAGPVYVLAVAGAGLFVEELGSVDEEAVDCETASAQ